MNTRRADLVFLAVAVAAFTLLFWGWTSFLEMDTCLDWGGAMEHGTCVGARQPIPTFWDSPLSYKLFTVVPAAVIAVLIAGAVDWFITPSKHQ
jgi:hypothetical protein